jgi:hypothetical protein
MESSWYVMACIKSDTYTGSRNRLGVHGLHIGSATWILFQPIATSHHLQPNLLNTAEAAGQRWITNSIIHRLCGILADVSLKGGTAGVP